MIPCLQDSLGPVAHREQRKVLACEFFEIVSYLDGFFIGMRFGGFSAPATVLYLPKVFCKVI